MRLSKDGLMITVECMGMARNLSKVRLALKSMNEAVEDVANTIPS